MFKFVDCTRITFASQKGDLTQSETLFECPVELPPKHKRVMEVNGTRLDPQRFFYRFNVLYNPNSVRIPLPEGEQNG